jgi:type IV pilus assembly protein PilN
MNSTVVDLLREKRQALGLPEPADETRQARQTLLRGVLIGSLLIGLALGMGALVVLRRVMLASELEKFATVEAEVERFETRLRAERSRLSRVKSANDALVQGVLAVRSGSALLRDLQLRVPRGVQLTDVKEQAGGQGLLIKGVAVGGQPFALINALQLELKRSPLFDPNRVVLRKASREQTANQTAMAVRDVIFELDVKFRPAIQPLAEKQILEQLGADGLAARLALLQREELLP